MPALAFTKDEVETLLAVFDTLIPVVDPADLCKLAPTLAVDVDPKVIETFAAEVPSANPEFMHCLTEILPTLLTPAKVAELKQAIGLLRSRIGMLALGHTFTPFHQHPVAVREQLLLSWKHARLPVYRRLFDSFAKLGATMYLRRSAAAQQAMLYQPTPTTPAENLYDFSFTALTELKHSQLDAIVVGSGSGGGVVAKELSEAGLKVLVIEKGQHYSLNGPAFNEADALEKLYWCGGASTNDYGDIGLVQGQTFGGGSSVNWAASIQTPAAVRQDWASSLKLPYFKSSDFQEDLDAVWKYMGVSQPKSQNVQNTILLEGARRCGYAAIPVAQNNGNAAHGCNHDCANGCRSGGKKGGVHSWLVDAARNGAQFLTGVDVRRIVLSKTGQAEGVLVRSGSGEETVISAPRVFVCGGSIESPALLLRSKISNSRIGASLYLHPTNYLFAVFDEKTKPTEGNILTSVVGEYANLSPSGHGVRVETGIMQPTISMSLLQWSGGLEHKARMAKHSHMVGCIAIARDLTPGRVRVDDRGEPVVDYTVSAFDARSVVTGTLLAADCMYAMDANEIIVAGRGVEPWKRGDDFEAWKKLVEAGVPCGYGSAHQMGSNRMASSASTGVCDPDGAVYGVTGVYCADASVLPSASGVNPMISTMAVARKIVRGVIDDIKNPGKAAKVAARL